MWEETGNAPTTFINTKLSLYIYIYVRGIVLHTSVCVCVCVCVGVGGGEHLLEVDGVSGKVCEVLELKVEGTKLCQD